MEGPVEPLERVNGDYAMVFDGMAYVQQSQVTNLEKILTIGSKAARIDVMFDVYRDIFIKNVERNRLSKGQLLLKTIITTSQMKQWGSFLPCNEKKKLSCGTLCLTVEKRRKPTKNWAKTILCHKLI